MFIPILKGVINIKRFLIYTSYIVLVGAFFVVGRTFALPTKAQESVEPASNGSEVLVSIPEHAVEVSPDVFSLGEALHNGQVVEGYAFVDRVGNKRAHQKPGTECGNNMCEPSENANNCPVDCGNGGGDEGGDDATTNTSSCYEFLAKDAKWKSVEPWEVNPKNARGLNETSVFDSLVWGIDEWEDAANFDILGEGSTTNENLTADMDSPDEKNEVYFADITDDGAIGVTIVWGIFSGPPFNRQLVEWDQVYDDVDFDWSEDCTTENCTGKMDFPSIAIHELGHSVGLGDLYTSSCTEETMYGYASVGETKKRSLNAGDITGISELY